MSYINRMYKKIRLFLPAADRFLIDELRKKGGLIGENVKIYSPTTTIIDMQRPYLLSIGDDVLITRGCIILTHDYSKAVLKQYFGEEIGEGRKTIIGNNVFIGMNSIILMGAEIGNNVIIGAGSIVHGKIPDNVVVAGNPAKVICSLEDYLIKRREKTIEESVVCAQAFRSRVGRDPTAYDMRYFKWLFTPRDRKVISEYGFKIKEDDLFWKSDPIWNGFDAFLRNAYNKAK